MGLGRHALCLFVCTLFVLYSGLYAILPKSNWEALSMPQGVGSPGGEDERNGRGACRSTTSSEEGVWTEIRASEDLVWTDCYQGKDKRMQCARLLVPLNYSAPLSDSNQASIALLRVPSAYSSSHPSYLGPILFNPGGPGGSGVDLILSVGDLLHQIVGKEFDVVGFDPRGVARSLPRVDLFRDRVERAMWEAGEGIVDPERERGVFGRKLARAGVIGRLAERVERSGGGYLRSIQTDHTARDMLRITEKQGRDKLLYWGFSYGTILGATFAAMFPDKVGRLVIDGVADSENYFATLWSNNLIDTDKTMQWFFDSCYEAGPSNCPFYASSPEAISQRLTKLYDTLKMQPIPVVDPLSSSTGMVDYPFLRTAIFTVLYKPYAFFPALAKALADLEGGNASSIWSVMNSAQRRFRCSCGDDEEHAFESISDATPGIMCTDGKPISGTLEDTEAHYREMKNMSGWADVWANIRVMCSSWPDFPRTHFQGPFEGNTSHPLLVIGNTADPVTPLWAAKKMSKGYPGSVVLTQDSPGHCSIAGPSVCTINYVRDYFQKGTLPPEGTVCPVLSPPIPTSQTRLGDENQFYTSFGSLSESSNLPLCL
ncbi:hypothetical protein AMATHDRAFT_76363 [Amanita thiersii Skay4041]|uniref:Peptidase S33 tripeptidyl aminopeptidase-like C-terminal domain-containing protein n=1 Tax=Amanita thiersii Skay4041 TaxID=703135 RepID=A0A2A9NN64_9AGAR|nr:hypothetical protein AMATHDRAFT_76363 [Amanita thiersii Skay4041]